MARKTKEERAAELQYLDKRAAAVYLGVPENWFREQCRGLGGPKETMLPGSKWARYSKKDLDEWKETWETV